MREQPWNIRRLTTEHHLWYQNLVQLHLLTSGWLKEIGSSGEGHQLPRGATKDSELSESLSRLQRILERSQSAKNGLESLMDDTYPEDVLGRLEHTVWAVQSLALSKVLSQTQKQDRQATLNQLEQLSWKAGREAAQERWPDPSESFAQDIRSAFSAFRDSPFSGCPKTEAFLVRRAVSTRIELELLACPHRSEQVEVSAQADHLCSLHAFWAKGYLYALNSKITIEHRIGDPKRGERCSQSWFYLT